MLPDEQAAMIPDDIRSDPGLQSFNDVGSLAKSYLETKSMVGRSIQLPAKESKPEDIEKWSGDVSAKLKDYGYTIAKPGEPPPKGPDAYEFKIEGVTPAQMNEDVGVKAFRTFAHKNGMSNAKAQEFVEFYAKEIVPKLYQEINAGAPEMIEDDAAVEKILTEKFQNETARRREDFNRGVTVLSRTNPDLKDFLEGTSPYGSAWIANKNHPALIHLISEVARSQMQDFGGHVAGLTATDTMESVNGEIEKLRKEAEASNDQFQRENLGAKMSDLYRKRQALVARNGR